MRLLPAALTFAAAVMAAVAFPLPAVAQPAGEVGPGYDIEMSRMIRMRDGVKLEGWIFKPSNLKAKAPAVLELTQYDIDGSREQDFKTFVQRGYVSVQVEVRGRGVKGFPSLPS
jgi:predicted acyl esterase